MLTEKVSPIVTPQAEFTSVAVHGSSVAPSLDEQLHIPFDRKPM